MLLTEKTQGQLVALGAPPNCPRDYWNYPDDHENLGFNSAPEESDETLAKLLVTLSTEPDKISQELVTCRGFAEQGWTKPLEHLHPICQICIIRGLAKANRAYFNT